MQRLTPERAQQPTQGLGAHVRLTLAVELHVGGTAIRPVPQQHPVAAGHQRFGEWTQAWDLLAEPAAGRQDDEIA